MPCIQNVSLDDIRKGCHIRVNENSTLIQIVDPDMQHPEPLYKFGSVHKFKFLDIEENGLSSDGCGGVVDMSWGMVTDQQAQELVNILQDSLDKRRDVVVHCVMGVCRSGAVAEVGVQMGFQDTETFRSPNLLVKHKMMKVLGWTYDEDETPSINGVSLDKSWF
jgi:predicted protein tyrosine phosphatase